MHYFVFTAKQQTTYWVFGHLKYQIIVRDSEIFSLVLRDRNENIAISSQILEAETYGTFLQLSDQLQIHFTSLSCSVEGHLLLLFFLCDVKKNKKTKVNSVREHDPCGPALVHIPGHREITAVINTQ